MIEDVRNKKKGSMMAKDDKVQEKKQVKTDSGTVDVQPVDDKIITAGSMNSVQLLYKDLHGSAPKFGVLYEMDDIRDKRSILFWFEQEKIARELQKLLADSIPTPEITTKTFK